MTGSTAALRKVSLAGASLFGAALVVAIARPEMVERRAHAYVVAKVMQEARKVAPPFELVSDAQAASRLSANFAARADSLRNRLDAGLSRRLAEILASMCHYCQPADSLEALVRDVAEHEIGFLEEAAEKAAVWARERYTETVTALVRDLRIFGAVNAALFVIVVLASLVAPLTAGHAPRLALWLVLAATLLSILGYVFLQNWFYALLTGRFVGFGYAAWVGVVFAVLVDWTFNRGRISQLVVDFAGSVVGSFA